MANPVNASSFTGWVTFADLANVTVPTDPANDQATLLPRQPAGQTELPFETRRQPNDPGK